jgi:transcriptional regulator with XRE-family HTH domain
MDGVRFGRSVRELRGRRSWRQDDLAQAAGVSRSVIARVEQGRADRVTIRTLESIVGALGARLVWRLDWRGEALDHLLDRSHAETVEWIVRTLRAFGWAPATEVSFNVFGERGSIDVLAFEPRSRALLVVEVKASIGDIQDTHMRLDRKARLAPRIAGERGWSAALVGKLLVIRSGSTARRRVTEFEATFGSTFPDRAIEVRRWLKWPSGKALAGLWFVSVDTQTVARKRSRVRQRDVTHSVPAT